MQDHPEAKSDVEVTMAPGMQVATTRGRGRGRGQPPRIGHFADEFRPSQFCVLMDEDDLYMQVIPRGFEPLIKGPIPRSFRLKTCERCSWFVELERFAGELVFHHGWPQFAAAHGLKENDMLVFKLKGESMFKVKIFDAHTSMVRVISCPDHP